MIKTEFDKTVIGVIGLGYVGLPLAVAFGETFQTFAYDRNSARVEDLNAHRDPTGALSKPDFSRATGLVPTNNLDDLKTCNFYVIAVPTPIDEAQKPDLSAVIEAVGAVAKLLSRGDIVVLESTVYPGLTEDVCVPILERGSALKVNDGFYVGYSPERVNPGDKTRQLKDIVKVVSGSTPYAADKVEDIYNAIIPAGTHRAESIKVAEAAKVLENTQRDINIALMNEFSKICHALEIETKDVLRAAGTKWNFLNFEPGLVGGHCTAVDPHYLAHKAETFGVAAKLIRTAREINDDMACYLADQIERMLRDRQIALREARVLVMGLAFKENCADMRNSRSFDIAAALSANGAKIKLYDPLIDPSHVPDSPDFDLVTEPRPRAYDAIVVAVAHKQFVDLGIGNIRSFGKDRHIVVDVKGAFSAETTDFRL